MIDGIRSVIGITALYAFLVSVWLLVGFTFGAGLMLMTYAVCLALPSGPIFNKNFFKDEEETNE